MFEIKNYINGMWVNGIGGIDIDPCTENTIGTFPETGGIAIRRAIEQARISYLSWRKKSRVQRSEYFDRLCSILKSSGDYLARVISLETGKNFNESLAEVNESLHMAQYAAGKGREQCGKCVSSELPDRDAYVIRKPKGVVAVISPWNFPAAIGGFWCTAPALLEGNSVIWKPSDLTPMTAQVVVEFYEQAGFPSGVINLIHGGDTAGEILAGSNVDHICFTGSAAVGRAIRQVCTSSIHPKTCSCEMGSKSAVIVLADADMDMAVEACVVSAYKLSGQRCVSAGRILIETPVFDEFCDRFVQKSKEIKVGPPFKGDYLKESPTDNYCGPLISNKQMDHVVHYNEMVNESKDVTVLLKCERIGDCGFFLTPHVYKTRWGDQRFLQEEVFGPHVALVPVYDVYDAVGVYNDTKYGLALSVITNDFRKAKIIRDDCDFGLGYWNNACIGAESHLPFGGIKGSGYGGSSAAGMFDAVSHEISWTVNHGELNFPQGLKS